MPGPLHADACAANKFERGAVPVRQLVQNARDSCRVLRDHIRPRNEVRALGRELAPPETFVGRHPFLTEFARRAVRQDLATSAMQFLL
jgi:hypothetical protein